MLVSLEEDSMIEDGTSCKVKKKRKMEGLDRTFCKMKTFKIVMFNIKKNNTKSGQCIFNEFKCRKQNRRSMSLTRAKRIAKIPLTPHLTRVGDQLTEPHVNASDIKVGEFQKSTEAVWLYWQWGVSKKPEFPKIRQSEPSWTKFALTYGIWKFEASSNPGNSSLRVKRIIMFPSQSWL